MDSAQSLKRQHYSDSFVKHTVKRPCYDQKVDEIMLLQKEEVEQLLYEFEYFVQNALGKDVVINHDKLCIGQVLSKTLLRTQSYDILAEIFFNLIEYLRQRMSYDDIIVIVHNLHLSKNMLYDVMTLCDNTQILLDAKYNVDIMLYNAVQHQHIDSVKLLIAGGADPTHVPACLALNGEKMVLLYHAACQCAWTMDTENIKVTEFLMQFYSLDQLNKIFYALATDTNSSLEMLLLFKNRGVDIDYLPTNDNRTALMRACDSGFDCRCIILIELGANVNYVNNVGDSPLQLACKGRAFGSRYSQECFNIVQALVTKGADVNYSNKGNTALSLLLEKKTSGSVFGSGFGLVFGPKIGSTNGFGSIPAMHAPTTSTDTNASGFSFGAFGTPRPTYESEIATELKTIIYLIEKGTDVNHVVSNKFYGDYSLLAHAYRHRKDMKILECLLSRGADVNYVNCTQNTKKTVLMMALEDSEFEIVKLLLRYKADPTTASKQIEQYLSFSKVLDDYVKSY